MNIKKIYPAEWRKTHPDGMVADSDHYYANLANRVAQILAHSGIDEAFPDGDSIRYAAMRLTAYFEDICTGVGIWKTLNDTCRKRYGKPLPFHDTTDYCPGEPNRQDVQLLLWDIIQSYDCERFINPENPGIAFAAGDIYGIFDQEYETAPDTPELTDYLRNPSMQSDFWQMRKRIEWIFMQSYINLRGRLDFADSLAEISHSEHAEQEAYNNYIHHLFTDRHNMAVLTPGEWLSALSDQRIHLDASLFANRCYRIVGIEDEALRVRDLVNDKELSVEKVSFEEKWVNNFRLSADSNDLYMGLVRYNDKYYQCGSMLEIPAGRLNPVLEQVRRHDYQKSLMPSNEESFYKASGGKPIVFLKGIDAIKDFYGKKIGIPLTGDHLQQMLQTIREQTDDGMVAVMGTPNQGNLIITGHIPAIKHKDNPFYDKEYASKYGQGLLMDPMAIDYSAVCTMIDQGMLADVALNSLRGPEYGRQLLQDNIQFVADYMFAQHR